METVKLELGDGDYAVVFKEMKHKTSKAIQDLLRRSVTPDKWLDLQSQLQKEADIEKRKAILRPIQVDGDDVITILNQTESWSFGAVTEDTIDNMTETKYQLLLSEVNKLYSQAPLAPKS